MLRLRDGIAAALAAALLFAPLATLGVIATAQAEEQGGVTANATGKAFEGEIQALVVAHGYRVLAHREWTPAASSDASGENLLLTNAPYQNIYGGNARSEFLLLPKGREEDAIRIEAKWKQSFGSTDERLAYLYLNAVSAYPENHVIIVVDGDGWREGAVAWLREAAASKAYTTPQTVDKKIEVMNLKQFESWVEQNLGVGKHP